MISEESISKDLVKKYIYICIYIKKKNALVFTHTQMTPEVQTGNVMVLKCSFAFTSEKEWPD